MGDNMTSPIAERELRDAVTGSLESVRNARGGLARVRERLRNEEASRFRKPMKLRHGRVIAIVTSLAVAAGAVLAIRQVSADAPLAFRVERGQTAEQGVVGAFIGAPKGAEIPLVFSDGTRIGVAPSARLRVAEVEARGARLILENGEAHVNVVHKASTRWRIDAGPFAVHVTGTTFDVAWDPAEEALVVKLTSGSVVVTGCDLGDGRRVSTGEQLRVHCRDHVAGERHDAAVEGIPTTAIIANQEVPATSSPLPPVVAPMALPVAAPPIATPAPSDPLETASAGELLALGERARYAGTERAAVDAFTALRRRYPGTDAAAAAAFELGRLAADKRGDFAAAAEMFDACMRERPQGNLAREAMGRGLEARERAGDRARAAALASEYLRAYPAGPHAVVARRVLARETP
jgi:transmembrane sensor